MTKPTTGVMRTVCVFIAVGLLLGCAPKPANDKAAPSAKTDYEATLKVAKWAALAYSEPPLVGTVSPTGSMLPVLDERCLVLLEPYKGQKLYAGDIIVFNRSDKANVIHRVIEVNDRAVYISGDNNMWPDGWYTFDKIDSRVCAIFYSSH